jgi:hypothetical protein
MQSNHADLLITYEKLKAKLSILDECIAEREKEFEEIKKIIENYKKDILDTEKNTDIKYTDGALIAISGINNIIDKIKSEGVQE